MRALAISLTALAAFAATGFAQAGSGATQLPTLADTILESPTYPVGDAAGVYRAVLDLLYLDGGQRPPVIVMHDSAEGRSEGPCAFSKCLSTWSHLSKIDTATLLGFARMGRRRPAIVRFGYPVPIVFLSYDDVHRMTADGNELLRAGRHDADKSRVQSTAYGSAGPGLPMVRKRMSQSRDPFSQTHQVGLEGRRANSEHR